MHAPDRDALHVLLMAARHPRAALLAVEDTLAATGAELCGFSLKPVGRIVEGVLRVRGLDDLGAERLAARLAARIGVDSVRLEHHRGLA